MGIPTQKVMSLSSQGLSDPEIIRTLQQEGHSPVEIDRAMKDAMRSSAGPGGPPMAPRQAHTPPAPPAPAAPRPAQYPQQNYGYQPQHAQMPPQPGQRPPMQHVPPSPPAPPAPTGPASQTFQRNRFEPTDWPDDDDMLDDSMDDLPKERKIGPGAFLSDMEPKFPGPRDELDDEKEPLPFARAPLPKDKDDRERALKDRKRRDVEELIEQITEEKWRDISGRIQELDEKSEKLSAEIKNASAQGPGTGTEDLSKMKDEMSSLKQSIEETNARIDSLEEVVKGSLTPMLNSIRKMKSASDEAPAGPPPVKAQQPSAIPDHEPGPARYAPKPPEEEDQ